MHRPTLRLRARAVATALAISVILVASQAIAGKDHCRSIELTGSAGGTSADQVELQVTDIVGNIVDRSCKILVTPNECADDLAEKIVANWGNGSQGGQQSGSCTDQALTRTCGKNLDISPVDPLDSDVTRIFCKHRYRPGKVKGGNNALADHEIANTCPEPPLNGQKAVYGEFKKLPKIEICCYEADPAVAGIFNYQDSTHCSGKKLGKSLKNPARIEVSVFNRIDHWNLPDDGVFFDPRVDPPTDNTLDVPVGQSGDEISLDPIGFVQAPSPKGVGCRVDLGKAAASLSNTTADVVVRCILEAIKTETPGVDCYDLGVSDQKNQVPRAVDAVRSVAVRNCEGADVVTDGPRISPATYGIRTCPPPCDSITLGLCSAGLVGSSCSTDRQCDTLAGAADGKCGDWDSATDCISCLQAQAAVASVEQVFGNPSPAGMVPFDAANCLVALANSLAYLSESDKKELLGCQAKADAAKKPLPQGVGLCRNADVKGLRAKNAAKIQNLLDKNCISTDIASLNVCAGALTTADLGDCVVATSQLLVDALSRAVFPESDTQCGNDLQEQGEQCDGTDDGACIGLCQVDCTCPPPACGNDVVEEQEQCDGLSDLFCPGLCQLDCTCPPPICGNDIREAIERCDGAADGECPGQCQPDCTCPPAACGNNVREATEACDGSDDAACPGACLVTCNCP